MNRLILGLGALALAGSFIGGAFLAREEPPVVSALAESDLFSFIQPSKTPAVPEHVVETRRSKAAPDPELRAIFDRHLTLGADRPITEVRQQIEQELTRRFSGQARTPARALLDKYIQYRQQSEPVQAAIDKAADVATLRAHIRTLQDLRRRLFSANEITALFPADDAYEKSIVARLEIHQNAALSDEQKYQQLQALEASLPPEVQAAEEARSNIVRLDSTPIAQTGEEGEEDVYRAGPVVSTK